MTKVLTLIGFIAITACAQAQQTATTPPAATSTATNVLARPHRVGGLQLTADQHQKISSISTNFTAQVNALFADKSMTREDRQKKLDDLKIQRDAQVKTILTPEQWQELQKRQAVMQQRLLQRRAAAATNAPTLTKPPGN